MTFNKSRQHQNLGLHLKSLQERLTQSQPVSHVRISNSFVLGNYRENVLYSFDNYSSHRFCIILIGLSPKPRAACSLIPFTAAFRKISPSRAATDPARAP